MILKQLEIGDIFKHARSRSKHGEKYVVIGNPSFDKKRRCYVRICRHLGGENFFKSCDLLVMKVGESVHKVKMREKYLNQRIRP